MGIILFHFVQSWRFLHTKKQPISISYNFVTMIDIKNLQDKTHVHHYYYTFILPIFFYIFLVKL
jgi:hypothetical protein